MMPRERRVVDALVALIGRQRHRRLEQGFARDHVVAAGQVLAVAAQVDAREDHLRAGGTDVDADAGQRHMVLDPDRIVFQALVRIELEMVVIVIGVVAVLMHEILAEQVVASSGVLAARLVLSSASAIDPPLPDTSHNFPCDGELMPYPALFRTQAREQIVTQQGHNRTAWRPRPTSRGSASAASNTCLPMRAPISPRSSRRLAEKKRQRQGAAVHGGSARERRHGDGPRLLPHRRQAGRRDGARDGRHRQHPQRHDQRRARQHSGAARRRAHADHRDRQHRVAQPADPLGPGVVRPGRHAARIRQVGLRAARRPAGRRRGRPRARHRDERAARPGLPDAAARSAQRPDRSDAPRHRASARLARAGAGAGRNRRGDAADRQGRVPADRHLDGRAGRGGGRRARRAGGGVRHPGGAVGSARHEPADRSPHASRPQRRRVPAEGRRGDRDRQRGAVDAAQRPAAQGRQDHPHLGRSAGDPLSVPRARGRPLRHRLFARRHVDAAPVAGRRHEGQEVVDRKPAQGARADARGHGRQAH